MERRLAAIMAVDVVGYSRLMGKDETGTLVRLQDLLRSVVRPQITLRSGRIVKLMGDGLLAEFASVVEAVECALDVQAASEQREPDLAPEERIRLRIGINLGDVIVESDDLFGDGVNVAARLEALAEPGGICISRAVRDQIRDRLEVRLDDAGEIAVKNIARPVRTFHVCRKQSAQQANEIGPARFVLSADVRSFALLMGDDRAAAEAGLEEYRQLFLSALKRHAADDASASGDAIGAGFGTADAAVQAAIEAQDAIARRNSEVKPEDRIKFRVGIDTGEGSAPASNVDITGSLGTELKAGPGEICISGAVHAELSAKTAADFKAVEADAGTTGIYRLARWVSGSAGDQAHLPLQCQGFDLPLPGKPSIIVMPFKVLGSGDELGHLAEGIRIDIQSALVKISGLFTIAAGSAGLYTDRDVSPADVAREMGVRFVLQCAIQGSSRQVRVVAQLIDGETGNLIWAERYDRKLDDTFLVQDEICEEVVTALDVKLVSGEQAKVWRKTLRDPKALELYYRGLDLLINFSKESVAAARQHFEAVSNISPNVTLGPTCVAFCHYWDVTMGWSDVPDDSLRLAGEWAEKAAAMDDADGQGHIILAHVKLLNGQHDEALKIARQAVEIRPSCANTNALFGNILIYCGHPAEAVSRIKSAIRIAPVYASWWIEILTVAYRDNGDYARAVSAGKEAVRLAPRSSGPRAALASAFSASGRIDLARVVADGLREIEPGFAVSAYARQHPYRDPSMVQSIQAMLTEAGLPD
jgi:class 3 adenylate cyclase/tetratricopeptide (TPR) repeat protein